MKLYEKTYILNVPYLNRDDIKFLKTIFNRKRLEGYKFFDIIINEGNLLDMLSRSTLRFLKKVRQKIPVNYIFTINLDLDIGNLLYKKRLGDIQAYDDILKKLFYVSPSIIVLRANFGVYPWENPKTYYLKKEILRTSLLELKEVTNPIKLMIEPSGTLYDGIILKDIADECGINLSTIVGSGLEEYASYIRKGRDGYLKIKELSRISDFKFF